MIRIPALTALAAISLAAVGCNAPSGTGAQASLTASPVTTELAPAPFAPLADIDVIPEIPSLDASRWVNGAPVSFESLRKDVVLVEVWSRFCHICRESAPAVAKLRDTYAPRGLRVASVVRFDDEPGEAEGIVSVMKEEGFTHASFLDKNHIWHRKARVAGSYPYFFVVGHGGEIVLRHSGRLAAGTPNLARVEQAIEGALGPG